MMNLSAFIEKHVFVNQTLLVNDLIDTFEDMLDEISNRTDTDDEGNVVEKEIHEWWIVSKWLLGQLESRGEAILKDRYGSWWGRCCTGQAVANDAVIQEIFINILHHRSSVIQEIFCIFPISNRPVYPRIQKTSNLKIESEVHYVCPKTVILCKNAELSTTAFFIMTLSTVIHL